MKRRKNRIIEREAVNFTRSFFESEGCVFQEVDQANDYGKDAYVDLVEREKVTGLCAAIQIKGGKSYRKNDQNYRIPLDDSHLQIWRESTVPILGIVYDPDDKQIRWCNITSFLQSKASKSSTEITIDKDKILDKENLNTTFRESVARSYSGIIKNPLLQLVSKNTEQKFAALYDCFALGRADYRNFICLRYILNSLENEPFKLAIHLLSHNTPHPDIFWHKKNWITKEVTRKVRSHFVWTRSEISKMIEEIPLQYFQRGQIGESLYMLFHEDDQIKSKMRAVAIDAIELNKFDKAYTALYLWLYWEGENAKKQFNKILKNYSEIRGNDKVKVLIEMVFKYDNLGLF